MALALLCLTPLFKGPPKFMVIPHGDTCIVKTREQRLIQSHQGFVLPQRPLRGGGNAACLRPRFKHVVPVRVGQIAGGDFRAEIVAVSAKIGTAYHLNPKSCVAGKSG